MAITPDEVARVAQLARLRLSDEDLATMQEQLSRILDYIQLLQEVDVADVPPTAQATDIANSFREDELRPSLPPDEALMNAADTQGGLFRIPAVFDE
jgi:aspartyl-tRNA(Asn)/glutamyl-tRNA(Gln) amidotransferase subunit C